MVNPDILDPAETGLSNSPHRDVVVLCGNPRTGSRTSAAAQRLARRLLTAWGQAGDPTVVELADLGGAVIDGGPAVDTARATVLAADVLIVATPVYKASYTGLLKAFLDRIGGGELAGTVAVPFIVTGAPVHRLAADVHLRPLLVELGASTPTSAFAVEEADLPDLSDIVERWIDAEFPKLDGVLRASAVEGAA